MPLMTQMDRDPDLIDNVARSVLGRLARGELDWPLYLWGKTGAGKTCAVLCLMDRVPASAYFTLESLAAKPSDDPHFWASLRTDYRLVVIDEIGARDWDRDRLAIQRLADSRVYRPTIWVANHAPERLAEVYDDRTASRVLCGTIVHMVGPDRRC